MGEELDSQLSNAFKFKLPISKVIELMHFLYQIVSNAEVYYLLLTFLRLIIKSIISLFLL